MCSYVAKMATTGYLMVSRMAKWGHVYASIAQPLIDRFNRLLSNRHKFTIFSRTLQLEHQQMAQLMCSDAVNMTIIGNLTILTEAGKFNKVQRSCLLTDLCRIKCIETAIACSTILSRGVLSDQTPYGGIKSEKPPIFVFKIASGGHLGFSRKT